MGADLYIRSVIDAAHHQYATLSQMAKRAALLARQDLYDELHEEATQLFQEMQHCFAATTIGVEEFDLVSQIRDLANGEISVWQQDLASQLMQALERLPADAYPLVMQLGGHIAHLVKGQLDRPLASAIEELWQLFRYKPTPSTPLIESDAIARGVDCLHDLLHGVHQGTRHLFLMQMMRKMQHLLETLTSLTLDVEHWQETVAHLSQTEGSHAAPFAALHAAARPWMESLTVLQRLQLPVDDLLAAVQQEEIEDTRISRLLLEVADAFKRDHERSQSTHQRLHETLRLIFQLLERIPSDDALHETILSLVMLICLYLSRVDLFGSFLENLDAMLPAFVTGEKDACLTFLTQYLLEEARTVFPLLEGSAHAAEDGATIQEQTVATSVVVAHDVMEAHFQQTHAVMVQARRHYEHQAWEGRMLEADHSASLLIQIRDLVQKEPETRICALANVLLEALSTLPEDDPFAEALDHLGDLLEHLHQLAHGEPAQRIAALAETLLGRLPDHSPLCDPARRVLLLAEGKPEEALSRWLQALAQEIERHPEWAPSLRVALNTVVTYAREGAGETDPVRYLCRLLDLEMQQAEQTSEQNWPSSLRDLLQHIARETDDATLRTLLPQGVEALEEAHMQEHPETTTARFLERLSFLVKALRTWFADADAEDEPPTTAMLIAMQLDLLDEKLDDLLFPSTGYFRDPYNDASVLWMLSRQWWPRDILPRLEPVPEELAFIQWTHPRIAGQLSVREIERLFHDLEQRELTLPSSEHLARWGETLPLEDEGEYALDAWYERFRGDRQRLLAFLKEALDRQEPILCSL